MVIPRDLWVLPHMMVIYSIFPYSVTMSARTLEIMSGSTCDIFRSSTFQSMVHFLHFTGFFIAHQTYSFLWQPISYILLESFVRNISDDSRLTYIAFLDYEYIHFFPAIYIYEILVVGWVKILYRRALQVFRVRQIIYGRHVGGYYLFQEVSVFTFPCVHGV